MAASGVRVGGTSSALTLAAKRILDGNGGLAQLWFSARVLDKYREQPVYKIVRTNTVGRLRGPQWMIDFGIAGPNNSLIHVSHADAAARIPTGEREHWAAHATSLPASDNYLTMQITRGACVDDGDLRAW
jgi:hypothetical protein